MSPEEYLERLFADAFKREVDQDEAIWRSLPFFATAVGLAGALVGYVAAHLPTLSAAPLSAVLHGLIVLAMFSLAASGFWIWIAVVPRDYSYLPRETAQLAYMEALRAFHNESAGSDAADAAAVAEFRRLMIGWLADITTSNRSNNRRKQEARTQALTALFVATALAACAALIMFVSDRIGSI